MSMSMSIFMELFRPSWQCL